MFRMIIVFVISMIICVLSANPVWHSTPNDFYVKKISYYSGIESATLRVHLTVQNDYGEEISSAFRQISRILRNNSVILYENADHFLRGIVTINEVRTTRGTDGIQYIANAEIVLKMGDIKTDRILGSITGTGRGLSESCENDAKYKAFGNLSVNTRELRALLSSAEN